ncbi:hypothetical protein Tco_1512682 [Tanacetum coccineum]
MSDFEDSTVTYTVVSSPFADLPNIGSPGVDGPPVMPEDPYTYVVAAFQAPPSPDYVSGLEYPTSPNFVLEPVYPKFMPPEDEVLPAEEQPLPIAVSPTIDSPGYVPESDLKEDDDKDPKEDPADYLADGGDDGDDEDESSDDDKDDVNIKGDEEEEEHPAPADSIVVALPVVDQALSAKETDHLRPTKVARLLSIPTPPPSPLSPWSSPLPHIPSPPLPVSSPVPVISSSLPASLIHLLGYRAVMIRLRAETLSNSHSLPLPLPIILSYTRSDAPSSGTSPLVPIPLPTSSPPLHLLSTDRRADKPDVTLPPQKRLGIALGPRYEVGESSSALTARPLRGFRADYGFVATINREIMRDLERDVGYGIIDTWDEMLVDMLGAPATDDTELDDEQSERKLMAGRLNMLYRDRRAHAEVMSLRTRVVAQQAVITELQAADLRRQAAITEMLAADRRRQAQFIEALKLLKRLQT